MSTMSLHCTDWRGWPQTQFQALPYIHAGLQELCIYLTICLHVASKGVASGAGEGLCSRHS